MHYLYLLQLNDNEKQFYIGQTPDLRNRLKNHQQGKSKFTKKYLPVKLIYYEAYMSQELAKEREKQLKRFGSAYYALLKRLDIS